MTRRPQPPRSDSWSAAGNARPSSPKVELADDFVSLVVRGVPRVAYRRGKVRVLS